MSDQPEVRIGELRGHARLTRKFLETIAPKAPAPEAKDDDKGDPRPERREKDDEHGR